MIVIDRFEGDWAVLEWQGGTFNFPVAFLPEGAREGDIVKLSVTLDSGETERRRNRIRNLEKDLFKD